MKPHVHLFGVPVRVDASFLFLIFFFGYVLFLRGSDPHAWEMFGIWVPLVTGAVLAHELGHALVGRRFGLTPFVVLHGMGGLTTFPAHAHRSLSHGRRILIVLAGPGAGLLVGVVAFAIERLSGLPAQSVGARALGVLFWVTAGWGVLNLAPILPLDGGQVVATVLDRFFGPAGTRAARVGSILLALGAGGAAALGGQWFAAFLCAMLAFGNYRAIKLDARLAEAPIGPELEAGFALLGRGDAPRALALAALVAPRAKTDEERTKVAHLAAWAALLTGDGVAARAHLSTLPAGTAADAYLEGRVRLATGDAAGAVEPLLEALVDRGDEEIADALGDALARVTELAPLLSALAEKARGLEAPLAARVLRRVSPDAAAQIRAALEGARADDAEPGPSEAPPESP